MQTYIETFYLYTIEQLFLFVEQLDQLDVCLPDRRLLTGIPILAVFQNSRWNSNKTSLVFSYEYEPSKLKSDLFIFKFGIFRPTFGIMTQLLSLQWKIRIGFLHHRSNFVFDVPPIVKEAFVMDTAENNGQIYSQQWSYPAGKLHCVGIK